MATMTKPAKEGVCTMRVLVLKPYPDQGPSGFPFPKGLGQENPIAASTWLRNTDPRIKFIFVETICQWSNPL
jgi:hypothetical protein